MCWIDPPVLISRVASSRQVDAYAAQVTWGLSSIQSTVSFPAARAASRERVSARTNGWSTATTTKGHLKIESAV